MKLSSVAVAIGLSLAICTQASAVIIDFNASVESFADIDPFTTEGFSFASVTTGGLVGIWTSTPFSADNTPAVYNDTPYLLAGYGGLSITATDGSSFILNGWDLALGWYQSVTPNTVTATFELAAGGQVVQTLTLRSDSFSSTSLNQAVTRITLSSASEVGSTFNEGYISLDNINVSAVPEPASMALLLGGLALLGTAARRHQRPV
jgi:hypothetical protein